MTRATEVVERFRLTLSTRSGKPEYLLDAILNRLDLCGFREELEHAATALLGDFGLDVRASVVSLG